MKKLLYIFLLLSLFSINAKADDTCTKEELARIKELASKVEVNYNYQFKEVKQDGKTMRYPVFSLTANNLNRELRVLIIEDAYSQKYKEFKDGNKTTATINGFNEGDKVNITIKAFTANKCANKTVGSIIIKIPYYNRFSEEEKCLAYPEFDYCSEFSDSIITSNKFESEFIKFLDAKVKKNEEVQTIDDDSKLLLIIGIISGIVILLLLSTIIVKQKRKNSL